MSLLQSTDFIDCVSCGYTVRRLREEMEKIGRSLENYTDQALIKAMLEISRGASNDAELALET